MKNTEKKTEMYQRIAIVLLTAAAGAIMTAGLVYTVFALKDHLSLNVLNTAVPAAVFGIVVAFLGLRYLFAVQKLAKEITSSHAEFSWNNFRRADK